MMMLSKEIKVLRSKALLTQEAFALKIGVSASTIIRWENGKSKPNLTAMKSIKNFCDENSISYETLEKAWIDSAVGNNKQL